MQLGLNNRITHANAHTAHGYIYISKYIYIKIQYMCVCVCANKSKAFVNSHILEGQVLTNEQYAKRFPHCRISRL